MFNKYLPQSLSRPSNPFSFTDVNITRFQRQLKSQATFLALTTGIIGITVLIGWNFDIEAVKSFFPGFVAMNPATAICFILLGMSVIGLIFRGEYGYNWWIIPAFVASFIGMWCFFANLIKIEWRPDQILFYEKLNTNQMAPNTAFNFIISGISIILLRSKNSKLNKTAHLLVLLTLLVSMLSIIGYLYGARSFYRVLDYVPMAINTSIGFLLIGSSILMGTCKMGIMGSFTSNYLGSKIARNILPPIIIVPIGIGFFIIMGERFGYYNSYFGFALFTISNIIIGISLTLLIKNAVNNAAIARTHAEQKQRELNESLKKRTDSLEILNQELESFSYSVSHDLKAPLRAIHGFSQNLKVQHAHELGSEGLRKADIIISNSERMNLLIENLLEFSRITRKEPKKIQFETEALVHYILSREEITAIKNNHVIKVNKLLPSSGDIKLLEQVWINLISNAIKYSSKAENPEIEIGSYKGDDQHIYFIKDNGVGFNIDNAKNLFGVFKRLHSDKDFEGTGIGLSIVQRIVNRHGGKIWAEAEVNKGAKFSFSLPADQTEFQSG